MTVDSTTDREVDHPTQQQTNNKSKSSTFMTCTSISSGSENNSSAKREEFHGNNENGDDHKNGDSHRPLHDNDDEEQQSCTAQATQIPSSTKDAILLSSFGAETVLLPHHKVPTEPERLTCREKCNLTFALLAWACTICNLTLIVGTSSVVLLSIDETATDLAAVPLGAFFLGASLVSAVVCPWAFTRWKSKGGFLTGVFFGLVGTVLGAASIVKASTGLLIVACGLFGMATGIGFYLRFAVVEVVPSFFAARAMTLVVSGGCIAAFAGPESARATRYAFGEALEYLGVFVMAGVFSVCNALFTCLVQFPDTASTSNAAATSTTCGDEAPATATATTTTNKRELWKLLSGRNFLVPLAMSSLSFTIMVMPMSMVRVAMDQVGYSSRQSLTTVELHFLGMFGPGFVSGRFIQAVGHIWVCATAILVYAISLVFMLLAKEEDDGSVAVWIVGLFLLGVGWNLGYNSGSMWTTELYAAAPAYKSAIQAANECIVFAFTGAWIVSASYIYQAGGEGLEGWAVLNYVVAGLLGVMALVLVVNRHLPGPDCPSCEEQDEDNVEAR